MSENANRRPAILTIDDDEQVRALLVDLLGKDYECTQASSAEEALGILAVRAFDLVLSDINLGSISGLELVPQVLRRSPDTVVVMISGEQTIESAIQALRAGAFDYIMKPFDVQHVDAAVRRALQHQQLLAEKHRYENDLEELVKQRTAEVERLAYYDMLTDLPNRVLFADRLAQALANAQRNQQSLAVVFASLDRFKKINDTLGHEVGDLLIKEVGERMTKCLSEGDTVARFESDEFALLLTQNTQTEDLVELSRAISRALQRSFLLEGHEVYVTASIGISLFPIDGCESTTLLKNAGAALYRAKNSGGNNYQFYTADMNERALRRLSLETSLRRAIDNEEFVVYYQPQVEIETRRVVGMEALVRWQHPQLGLLSPVEFIPLAEDTGLILPIGAWVMETACAQARSWQMSGYDLRLAVNVSSRQFQQKDLLGSVVHTLNESGLDSSCLELELTESSIMHNPEAAIKTLGGLREMGVKVSIDDFGTGYSSLGYLKRLPLDTLKLDRTFVNDATSDPDDAALVMAIITLAHNLRLKVIAEGVETEEHLRFLRLLRCDGGQGYLFGKPLPADLFYKSIGPRGPFWKMSTLSLVGESRNDKFRSDADEAIIANAGH